MNIVLGSDHAGYKLKEAIKKHLEERHYQIKDVGTFSEESCNYSFFAIEAAKCVSTKECQFGILCCGSAEGVCIAANKVKNVRCGIGYNDEVTKLCRSHNDCNMIAFGARFMDEKDVLNRVDTFLKTCFEEGRHIDRLEIIRDFENK